jgi:hypothetical protein
MVEVCLNLGIPCQYELVSGRGEHEAFVHVVNRVSTTHQGRRHDYIIDASQHPGVVFPVDREALLAARKVRHLVDRLEILSTAKLAYLPTTTR